MYLIFLENSFIKQNYFSSKINIANIQQINIYFYFKTKIGQRDIEIHNFQYFGKFTKCCSFFNTKFLYLPSFSIHVF